MSPKLSLFSNRFSRLRKSENLPTRLLANNKNRSSISPRGRRQRAQPLRFIKLPRTLPLHKTLPKSYPSGWPVIIHSLKTTVRNTRAGGKNDCSQTNSLRELDSSLMLLANLGNFVSNERHPDPWPAPHRTKNIRTS